MEKKSVKAFDGEKCTQSRIEEGVSIRKQKRAQKLERRRDRPIGTITNNNNNAIQIDEAFLMLLKTNVSHAAQVACTNIGNGNNKETIAKGLDQLLALVIRDATTHALDAAFRVIPVESTCQRLVQLMSTFDEAIQPYVLKICNIFVEVINLQNPQIIQARWDSAMFTSGFFDAAIKHITQQQHVEEIQTRLIHIVLVYMDLHRGNAEKMIQKYNVQKFITKLKPEYIAWYLYIVMHHKKPPLSYECIMTKELWDFWIYAIRTTNNDDLAILEDVLSAASHCAGRPGVPQRIFAAVPFERWIGLLSSSIEAFIGNPEDRPFGILQPVSCILTLVAETHSTQIMDVCAKMIYQLLPLLYTDDYTLLYIMNIFYYFVSASEEHVKRFIQCEFLSHIASRLNAHDIHGRYQKNVLVMLDIVHKCITVTVSSTKTNFGASNETIFNMFFGTPILIEAMLKMLDSMNEERMIKSLKIIATALSWEKSLGYTFIKNQLEEEDYVSKIDNMALQHHNVDIQCMAQEIIDDIERKNHMDMSE